MSNLKIKRNYLPQNVFNHYKGIFFRRIILTSEVQRTSCLNFQAKQQYQPRIAVIDKFPEKDCLIDYDYIPDIDHMAVVKRFIEEGLPDAQIDTYGMSLNDGLSCILQNMKDGMKYDALNISLGDEISFRTLSKLTKKTITSKNVSQNVDMIRKLYSEKKDEESIQLNEILSKLDEISSKSTKIYISAGNNGKRYFNLFSLAKNVEVIGALKANNKKARFSTDNSLIKKENWETGVFKIKKMKDSNGKVGFDYTGDGTIDIYANETSSRIKRPYPWCLSGTSFSAPKALVRDLKNQN